MKELNYEEIYGLRYVELKKELSNLSLDNEEQRDKYLEVLQEMQSIVKRANSLGSVEDSINGEKPLFVEGDFVEENEGYQHPASRSEKDNKGMIVGIERKIEAGIKIAKNICLPPTVEFIYEVATIFNDEEGQITKKVSEFDLHALDLTKPFV